MVFIQIMRGSKKGKTPVRTNPAFTATRTAAARKIGMYAAGRPCFMAEENNRSTKSVTKIAMPDPTPTPSHAKLSRKAGELAQIRAAPTATMRL